ncbi:MAG TPA: RDD family protein [Candidatus Limnocylindrales bacterium]
MAYRSTPAGPDKYPLPAGLRVAAMSTRLLAWVVDGVILGGFQIAFWMVAAVFGALSVNPVAQKEIEASPMTLPSVAPYDANLPFLAALLVGFVLLNVAYATFFWARFRGLPGQRLASLQVASAETGRSLSPGKALVRAIVAVGLPVGALGAMLFSAMAIETTVPWSEIVNSSSGATTSSVLTNWSLLLDAAMLVLVLVPIFLLVGTIASATRQGPHDRLAGSLVVGRAASPMIAEPYGRGAFPGQLSGQGPEQIPGQGPGQPGTPGYWPGYENPPGVGPSYGAPPEYPPSAPDATPDAPGGGWSAPAGSSVSPAGLDSSRVRSPGDDHSGTAIAATVGRRAVAYLLDCILVYGMWGLLDTAMTATFLPTGTGNYTERNLILIGLAGGLFQLVYFAFSWKFFRATLGQRAMHLQVVQFTSGKAISWMDAVVRWAVIQGPFALATIVPLVARSVALPAAACWLAILFYSTQKDPNARGLHDRFVGTRVSIDL